jgi:hypothetical protein
VQVVPVPAGDPDAALALGFEAARGECAFVCRNGDGYPSKTWFQRCLDALDADEQVSLIWGLLQRMNGEGDLMEIGHAAFFETLPPQKQEFFRFWVQTPVAVALGGCCIRLPVARALFPVDGRTGSAILDAAGQDLDLSFMFRFMDAGFLPLFVPIVAHYVRKDERLGPSRLHAPLLAAFGRHLLTRGRDHTFRDGAGRIVGTLRFQQG